MKSNFEVFLNQGVIKKNFAFFFFCYSSTSNLQRIPTTFRFVLTVFFPQLIGDTKVTATSSHNDHRMWWSGLWSAVIHYAQDFGIKFNGGEMGCSLWVVAGFSIDSTTLLNISLKFTVYFKCLFTQVDRN